MKNGAFSGEPGTSGAAGGTWGNSGGSDASRIRFTLAATTTLESLWYDEQWHRELVADGLTDEQALREMVRVGFEEDGLSILWEMFGPPPETAKYFAQAISDICVVTP